MNVYDFDRTIYRKDSSIEFYKYFVKHYPQYGFSTFITIIRSLLKYRLKKSNKEVFKSEYFSFIRYIEDLTSFVREFVEKESKNINGWYLEQMKEDDVIISASPDFLVHEFAHKLGIKNVIASNVEIHTGKWLGKNCYGEEKAARFKEKYGNKQIDEFYSDSRSDSNLAQISRKAFFVRRGEIEAWKK